MEIPKAQEKSVLSVCVKVMQRSAAELCVLTGTRALLKAASVQKNFAKAAAFRTLAFFSCHLEPQVGEETRH